MVDQLPNLGREAEMLAIMGMSSMEDLFSDIPDEVRIQGLLPLPDPQSEEEIIAGLENARDESDEWKQLDILIKSLTDPAIFYKMMTRRADRRANKLKQRFEGLKSSKEKRK